MNTLTKREEFAKAALTGRLQDRLSIKECIQIADCMIAELSAAEFCEWKSNHGIWWSSCKNRLRLVDDTFQVLSFCPYCGKRIKEVK